MLEYILLNKSVLYTLIFIYGLAVGSFLNVVIYRLPIMLQHSWYNQCIDFLNLDKPFTRFTDTFNLFKPNSHCPKCQIPINVFNNIPLLSYLLQRGRCTHCQQVISVRYPFVELISGLLAVYLAWHFGWSWQMAAVLILSWLLLCLIFIDIEHQLLPDSLTLSLLWLGLLANVWQLFIPLEDAVIGAAAGYSSLWLVANLFKWVSKREGMGYGDFKLLAALGAWAGWQLLPLIILLSSIAGAIVGLSLIVFKGHKRHTPIPFGPYLAIAGWIALLWGEPIIDVYSQTLY